jgi:hypothetical protein
MQKSRWGLLPLMCLRSLKEDNRSDTSAIPKGMLRFEKIDPYQRIALQRTEKLRIRIEASLCRALKNSGFASRHRVAEHFDTQDSYQGIAL